MSYWTPYEPSRYRGRDTTSRYSGKDTNGNSGHKKTEYNRLPRPYSYTPSHIRSSRKSDDVKSEEQKHRCPPRHCSYRCSSPPRWNTDTTKKDRSFRSPHNSMIPGHDALLGCNFEEGNTTPSIRFGRTERPRYPSKDSSLTCVVCNIWGKRDSCMSCEKKGAECLGKELSKSKSERRAEAKAKLKAEKRAKARAKLQAALNERSQHNPRSEDAKDTSFHGPNGLPRDDSFDAEKFKARLDNISRTLFDSSGVPSLEKLANDLNNICAGFNLPSFNAKASQSKDIPKVEFTKWTFADRRGRKFEVQLKKPLRLDDSTASLENQLRSGRVLTIPVKKVEEVTRTKVKIGWRDDAPQRQVLNFKSWLANERMVDFYDVVQTNCITCKRRGYNYEACFRIKEPNFWSSTYTDCNIFGEETPMYTFDAIRSLPHDFRKRLKDPEVLYQSYFFSCLVDLVDLFTQNPSSCFEARESEVILGDNCGRKLKTLRKTQRQKAFRGKRFPMHTSLAENFDGEEVKKEEEFKPLLSAHRDEEEDARGTFDLTRWKKGKGKNKTWKLCPSAASLSNRAALHKGKRREDKVTCRMSPSWLPSSYLRSKSRIATVRKAAREQAGTSTRKAKRSLEDEAKLDTEENRDIDEPMFAKGQPQPTLPLQWREDNQEGAIWDLPIPFIRLVWSKSTLESASLDRFLHHGIILQSRYRIIGFIHNDSHADVYSAAPVGESGKSAGYAHDELEAHVFLPDLKGNWSTYASRHVRKLKKASSGFVESFWWERRQVVILRAGLGKTDIQPNINSNIDFPCLSVNQNIDKRNLNAWNQRPDRQTYAAATKYSNLEEASRRREHIVVDPVPRANKSNEGGTTAEEVNLRRREKQRDKRQAKRAVKRKQDMVKTTGEGEGRSFSPKQTDLRPKRVQESTNEESAKSTCQSGNPKCLQKSFAELGNSAFDDPYMRLKMYELFEQWAQSKELGNKKTISPRETFKDIPKIEESHKDKNDAETKDDTIEDRSEATTINVQDVDLPESSGLQHSYYYADNSLNSSQLINSYDSAIEYPRSMPPVTGFPAISKGEMSTSKPSAEALTILTPNYSHSPYRYPKEYNRDSPAEWNPFGTSLRSQLPRHEYNQAGFLRPLSEVQLPKTLKAKENYRQSSYGSDYTAEEKEFRTLLGLLATPPPPRPSSPIPWSRRR